MHGATGALAQRRRPPASARRARSAGRPAPGGLRSAVRCCCSRASHVRTASRPRSRIWSTRCASSATSGTTRLAASVGVEARRSATRSSSGLSGSWPIAETTGVRAARTPPGPAPRRRTAAGPRPSRRRGRPRSRRPRGRGRAGATASITSRAAFVPCIAAYRDLEPHRRPAAAARSRARRARRREFCAVTRPIVRGRNGSGRLRSAANRPSAASSCRRRSSRASSSPSPTMRISRAWRRERAAVGVERRLGVDTTLRALDQRRGQRVEDAGGCR